MAESNLSVDQHVTNQLNEGDQKFDFKTDESKDTSENPTFNTNVDDTSPVQKKSRKLLCCFGLK